MAKERISYVCQECGKVERKWQGKCAACNSWNSFLEQKEAPKASSKTKGRPVTSSTKVRATPITEIEYKKEDRFSLGIAELDRVLGGGLVPGSLILIGGEPGVGKSTLLLTTAFQLASKGLRTLYVSAEESASQTKMRAERLGAISEELYLLPETDLNVVFSEIDRIKPAAIIIDSVQTVYVPELDSAPGSVSQVREVCSRVMHLSKSRGICSFLVGHVTKDGAIAGPRTLEHMVDTVLSFENTRQGPFRIIRAHKNRFGSTNEIAVFEMCGDGLKEVSNPSAFFLAERPKGKAGSVVGAALEGSRPVLIELQALCVDSPFGQPRRTTLGIDSTRCALIAAVLERSCGLSVQGQDLFINVAGGINVNETAADLPVALAIASSLRGKPIDGAVVCFGEVGLSGEIRGVFRADDRLKEIRDLGFERAIVPFAGADRLNVPDGLVVFPVKSLEEAIDVAFV